MAKLVMCEASACNCVSCVRGVLVSVQQVGFDVYWKLIACILVKKYPSRSAVYYQRGLSEAKACSVHTATTARAHRFAGCASHHRGPVHGGCKRPVVRPCSMSQRHAAGGHFGWNHVGLHWGFHYCTVFHNPPSTTPHHLTIVPLTPSIQ